MKYQHIKTPDELPWEWRRVRGYPYLETMPAYWRHLLDVSHALFAQHNEREKGTYYLDPFKEHAFTAMQFDRLERPLHCLGTTKVDRNDEPGPAASGGGEAHKQRVAQLRLSARGTYFHCHTTYRAESLRPGDPASGWSVYVSGGGGKVSARTEQASAHRLPCTEDQIMREVVGYEVYLARCQAERELGWLANYAACRNLGLRPGTKLHNYETHVNYKRCKVNITVQQIDDFGRLIFSGATVRGSKKRFDGMISASGVRQYHVTNKNPANQEPVNPWIVMVST